MAKTQQTAEKTPAAVSAAYVMRDNSEASDIFQAEGLRLTSATGKTLFVYPDRFSAEVQHAAKLHGFKQKLVDAAAISRNRETGLSATVADKWTAVEAIFERLSGGAWNEAREGGTGTAGFLAQAIAEWKGKPVEAVRTWLATKSTAEKAALELNPAVKPIIQRLQAERAANRAKDVDEAALQAELDELS